MNEAIKIRNNIAKQYGITIKELLSESRKANLIRARRDAWYQTKLLTDLTFSEIGELYNRNLSNVYRGYIAKKQEIEGITK